MRATGWRPDRGCGMTGHGGYLWDGPDRRPGERAESAPEGILIVRRTPFARGSTW